MKDKAYFIFCALSAILFLRPLCASGKCGVTTLPSYQSFPRPLVKEAHYDTRTEINEKFVDEKFVDKEAQKVLQGAASLEKEGNFKGALAAYKIFFERFPEDVFAIWPGPVFVPYRRLIHARLGLDACYAKRGEDFSAATEWELLAKIKSALLSENQKQLERYMSCGFNVGSLGWGGHPAIDLLHARVARSLVDSSVNWHSYKWDSAVCYTRTSVDVFKGPDNLTCFVPMVKITQATMSPRGEPIGPGAAFWLWKICGRWVWAGYFSSTGNSRAIKERIGAIRRSCR